MSEILKRIFGNTEPTAPLPGDAPPADGGGTAVVEEKPVVVAEVPPVVEPVKKEETAPPSMWGIILHNDHSTPPDFVQKVLKDVWSLTPQKSYAVMLKAHNEGKSKVIVLTKELAETTLDFAKALIETDGVNGRNPRGKCELTFTVEEEPQGK